MLHIAMPADKVRLVCVQTDRFKTSSLIISAALPLDENAAANALMLRLLKRSCKKYPDFTLFYGKLDELRRHCLIGDKQERRFSGAQPRSQLP